MPSLVEGQVGLGVDRALVGVLRVKSPQRVWRRRIRLRLTNWPQASGGS